MELTGTIQFIGAPEPYTGRDGQTFCSRQLVLVTSESHPQTAVFTLRNTIAADFQAQVGQTATVHFDFEGFQSKNPNPNGNTAAAPQRYYNKLSAWRIDL